MRAIDRARPTIREVGIGVSDDDMRRLRQAEVLLNISRKVAGLESLEEVLAILVEMTTWEVDAERGSLFLNDPETNELYSRIALGNHHREIRILNTSGIAGHVYRANEGTIIHDAYADSRFDRSIDDQTGFITRSILCAPVRTVRGEVIGVIQALNKKDGRFTQDDLDLLEAMSSQAAVALQSTQFVERMKKSREQELEFLDLVADVISDIDLRSLLKRVMGEAARMLNAERSTLFLNDEKTNQLWSEVGAGLETTQIRFPNHLGIAGTVFTSGQSVNIPYAYADLRFNPAFDKQTGYFTRSILCVPVVNKDGKCIGVTQVLNRRGGPFSDEDESRLKAFTAQVSIALENAKLFADVQNMKNYNESMLQSMSNGVITIDEDGKIVTCNTSGLRIMRVRANDIVGRPAAEYFAGPNQWVMDKIDRVVETQESDIAVDAELEVVGAKVSTNLTVLPLVTAEGKKLGSMLMIEDISTEKRMKSTMSRYMNPGIADQLLAGGEEILGGKSLVGTVLFSDIRAFTTLTEELGPQGTVSLLNEYFTIMVDALQREDGMLDKFIGDAIMAVFGIPIARGDDEDRAVRAAIDMISQLFAWNKQRVDQGKRPIDMGIGLNTDTVVSGNIGSPKRMDYTIIGDGVNLAARLESACKQYGARILISENTYDKLRGTYRARQIDKVIVKGKTAPVGVYEILDYHTADSYPNLGDALGRFRDAVESYQRQRWDDAIDGFESVLSINRGDKCAQMYVERCLHFRAEPPPADWDGVWTMTSK